MGRAYREVTDTVINEDGELLQQRKLEVGFKESEPDFIKLYLNDIARINDLPKGDSSLLHELCKRIDYNNQVVLNATIKKQIAAKLGIKNYRQIDNSIQTLKKKGIFSSAGIGVLLANPYLFGRGSWEKIKFIRTTITYTNDGRFQLTEPINDKLKLETRNSESVQLNSSILPIAPELIKEFLEFVNEKQNTVPILSILFLLCSSAYSFSQLL